MNKKIKFNKIWWHSIFEDQIIEKENDSLDDNEFFNKDNISLDKFLEIRTKANTNEGKFIEKEKIDEKKLFKYLSNQNNNSFKDANLLGLEGIVIEKQLTKKSVEEKGLDPKIIIKENIIYILMII